MTEMLECAHILKYIVCPQSLKGVHRDVGSGISIPAPARSLTVNQCAYYIRPVALQHGVHMVDDELRAWAILQGFSSWLHRSVALPH